MKTKIFFILLIFSAALFSCNNDDDNNPQTCTTQGLFYTLANSALITAPETDLTTDLFPNSRIDPITMQSVPALEIFGNDSNGDFIVFVTEVLTLNAIGSADFYIGNGGTEVITVKCLAVDNVVGGLIRYELSGMYNNTVLDGEYCVTIDSVNP